ncbi:hypothetical protein JTM47_39165, partial [Pseudomonas aeruginosa]|nr:hypothetical protein [Pseudomonas aeruginosa]
RLASLGNRGSSYNELLPYFRRSEHFEPGESPWHGRGGEFSSQEARRLFSDAGLPTYRTPEGTITAFMHMVEYRRNQKQLRETPVLPDSLTANT